MLQGFCNFLKHTIHTQLNWSELNSLMQLHCSACVTCSALLSHVMKMERKRNGVAAELQTGHVGGEGSILGIQPL